MFDLLDRVVSHLEQVLGQLDPEVLEPTFAVKLVETFSKVEKLGAAGKTLVSRRVDSSGVWRKSGEVSAAQWMAKATGEPLGKAAGTLEIAKRVAELPKTDEALRKGELSQAQADQITSAAVAAPSFETELLEAAQKHGFSGLRHRCDQIRATASADEDARHLAIHRSRRLRHWTDQDGAFRLDAKLTPEAGGVFLAALGPIREKIFCRARKQGLREPYDSYSADALVEMAKQSLSGEKAGSSAGPKALVHVRVDYSALKRGYANPGETCEIAGSGPISVKAARAIASDSFLAAVVTDERDIKDVCHIGRTIPAKLRTALIQRDPVCATPSCNNGRFLEIDHIVPFAEGGPTQLDNLVRLCSYHHDQKTYGGYQLSGEPGAWRWAPPNAHSPP